MDLVLAWLSHVSHPTKERHALLWTIGLTLGVILGGNCGLGDFGHSVGFGNFSPVRGRNSSAPLSRLPCHLNAAYPHPLSKCQSQSATDCALVHCKLPHCSYTMHTILPSKCQSQNATLSFKVQNRVICKLILRSLDICCIWNGAVHWTWWVSMEYKNRAFSFDKKWWGNTVSGERGIGGRRV